MTIQEIITLRAHSAGLRLPDECEGYKVLQGIAPDGDTIFRDITFGAALRLAEKGLDFSHNYDGNAGFVIFSQEERYSGDCCRALGCECV